MRNDEKCYKYYNPLFTRKFSWYCQVSSYAIGYNFPSIYSLFLLSSVDFISHMTNAIASWLLTLPNVLFNSTLYHSHFHLYYISRIILWFNIFQKLHRSKISEVEHPYSHTCCYSKLSVVTGVIFQQGRTFFLCFNYLLAVLRSIKDFLL